MIKVIVGCKVKKNEDIQPILQKFRAHAITYPGFVSAENLVNEKDSSIIVIVSTWEKAEDWRIWEKSTIRQELLEQLKTLLVEEPKIAIYRVMPTVRWV